MRKIILARGGEEHEKAREGFVSIIVDIMDIILIQKIIKTQMLLKDNPLISMVKMHIN